MILVMDEKFIEFLYRIVFPGAVGRLNFNYEESLSAKKLTDYIWEGMPEELKQFYQKYHDKTIEKGKIDLIIKLQHRRIEELKMQIAELTEKENTQCTP